MYERPKNYFPPEPTRYDLDGRHQLDQLTDSTAFRLAHVSEQFLAWLKWPETLDISFSRVPVEEWSPASDSHGTIPHQSTLRLRAKQGGSPYSYDFETQLVTDGRQGIVDSADYTITKFNAEGYIIPWALSVSSLSRVLFPRRRAHIPANGKNQILQATAPVNGIAQAIKTLRQGKQSANVVDAYELNGKEYSDEELRTAYVKN